MDEPTKKIHIVSCNIHRWSETIRTLSLVIGGLWFTGGLIGLALQVWLNEGSNKADIFMHIFYAVLLIGSGLFWATIVSGFAVIVRKHEG